MMKTISRLLLFIMVMTMILTPALPASALSTAASTTQEKAVILNTLKIIGGTNGQFNLNNQLYRCEAVTFIVRLIGKEKHVMENKGEYGITTFSDISSKDWFAPYVGYCSANGFISKSSAQFNPGAVMTEKDFLKLVLVALDYRENIDFTYDTLYDKSIELGLISLSDYVNNYGKSSAPNRAKAVEILYNALTIKCRSNDKLLCEKLIDEGVVTRTQVMALGLIVDNTLTEITEVKSKDIDKIEIKLNEAISSVSGIKIYSKANDQETVDCIVASMSGDTVLALTAPLETKKEYIVELTGVKDTEGNVSDKLLKQFTGFEPQSVVSDFFRISKIEPVDGRSMKVYFTHPVTINSEVCLYYSILKDNATVVDGKQGGIKAGILNSDKNGILLSLDNNLLSDGELYTLSINGNMMSAYGVKLNDGMGDSMKFVAEEDENSKFELRELVAIDKKTLLLNFNKEVNSFLALQIFNFYITDADNNPIRISNTFLDSSGQVVYINLVQEMVKDKKYYLTINNLNDITKQEFITEQIYTYTANYGTSDTFRIDGFAIYDNQTVEVYFNKPLSMETAMSIDKYSVYRTGSSSLIRPEKVLYDSEYNPHCVKLYFSKANKLYQNEYEIRIDGMKDYLGNSINRTTGRFNGVNIDREDTNIEQVIPVSTDAVKVTFTKEIAFNAPNLIPSNFALEYTYNRNSIKKIPVSIIYVDAKTLVLKFDSLEYGTAYKIKITSLLDYAGNTVKGREKDFELKSE